MNDDIIGLNDKELLIRLYEDKFKSVMPEVHRQVANYEENKKNGTLKPVPNYFPLFNK